MLDYKIGDKKSIGILFFGLHAVAKVCPAHVRIYATVCLVYMVRYIFRRSGNAHSCIHFEFTTASIVTLLHGS